MNCGKIIKSKNYNEEIENFIGKEKFLKFKDIFGFEVSPFSIRFYPTKDVRTTENLKELRQWLDINVYPYVLNPQYFAMDIAIRNPELGVMKNYLKQIEDIILRIIESISGRK